MMFRLRDYIKPNTIWLTDDIIHAEQKKIRCEKWIPKKDVDAMLRQINKKLSNRVIIEVKNDRFRKHKNNV